MDDAWIALDGQLDEISERDYAIGSHSLLWPEFLQVKSKKEAGEYHVLKKLGTYVLSTVICQNFSKKVWYHWWRRWRCDNGIFADAKTETDKTIWMLAAELGQAPGL